MSRPRLCRICGHTKAAHEHYRPGSDCSGVVLHDTPFAGYPAVTGPCGCDRFARPVPHVVDAVLDRIAYWLGS